MSFAAIAAQLERTLQDAEAQIADLALTEDELATALNRAEGLIAASLEDPDFALPDSPAGILASAALASIGLGILRAAPDPGLDLPGPA